MYSMKTKLAVGIRHQWLIPLSQVRLYVADALGWSVDYGGRRGWQLFSAAMRRPPQPGQTKPRNPRRFNKNAAQLASSENIESDRPLAIARPAVDASNGDPTMPLYHI
jgi:hypothetical protein